MNRENIIYDKVLRFARDAHAGQIRKYTGEDYIEHPIEVSLIVKRHGGSLPMQLGSLLHDVLEDTKVTEDELWIFLSEVKELTPDEMSLTYLYVTELTDEFTKLKYDKYNRKCRKLMEAERLGEVSYGAQTIKYADILSNTPSIRDLDPGFAKTYLQEKKVLLKMMIDGDPILRAKCIEQTFTP